jgi:hypothetical protein
MVNSRKDTIFVHYLMDEIYLLKKPFVQIGLFL